ncbi:MAG: hypothetical protein QM398_07085 [Thermoproteota archaeon]|nr:hypothetical protein [Thermoproteota archaeon]NLD66310.1 hypothetical protein [Thermoproteota archaeon]
MRKILTIFALIVLISSSSYALMPSVNAAEVSNQQKGLTVLSDVLGLTLADYNTTVQIYPTDSYLGVIPQEIIRYRLEAPSNTMDVLYTFADGRPRMIQVLENKGTPYLAKTTSDVLEMTKSILNKYEGYSKSQYYTELLSMIEDTKSNENSTIISENTKLEITTIDNTSTFRWTYIANGVEAPDKCVVLHYQDGFLGYFIDNWSIYNIGSTDLSLSEDQAIEIAMKAAAKFSWKIGTGENAFEVKDFNVTQAMVRQTVFISPIYTETARDQDPLTLYPIRHVWVSLDKFYPGNVYGIEVYIWADTQEVCHIQERVSTIDPQLVASFNDERDKSLTYQAATGSQANSPIMQMLLPATAIIMLGTVPMLLIKKKNFAKRRHFKISGALLCLLLTATMFFSISAVSAEPTRRALVWGSESTGAYDAGLGSSTRKTQGEVNLQRQLSQYISDYFRNDGYTASNYQGTGSIKAQILNNITNSQQYYSKTAVIDFNHGVGNTFNFSGGTLNEFHYMFEDNIGTWDGTQWNVQNGVYDNEIFPRTANGKAFFVFINTCLSAGINATVGTYQLDPPQGMVNDAQGQPTDRARGMPYAWTHRTVYWKGYQDFNTNNHISLFGYAGGANGADNGAFCYIGFPYGSAALDQTVQEGSAVKYWLWVQDFLYRALSFEITINQALDYASQNRYSRSFGETDLYTNFDAIWPMWNTETQQWDDDGFPDSTMAVYGNGNIRLYEYFVHSPYVSSSSYGSGSVSNQNGFTGAQPDGSYTRLRAVNVNDQAGIIGSMGYSGANLANGHIWIYGYSSGYTSRLRMYASYYSDSGWQPIRDVYVGPGGAHWIDCGSYATNFRYISFAVYRQSSGDYSNDIYLDTVLVLPPLPNP